MKMKFLKERPMVEYLLLFVCVLIVGGVQIVRPWGYVAFAAITLAAMYLTWDLSRKILGEKMSLVCPALVLIAALGNILAGGTAGALYVGYLIVKTAVLIFLICALDPCLSHDIVVSAAKVVFLICLALSSISTSYEDQVVLVMRLAMLVLVIKYVPWSVWSSRDPEVRRQIQETRDKIMKDK